MIREPKQREMQSPKLSFDLSGIKILVVDDDIDSQEFVTLALELQGAEAISVSSAYEALVVLPQAMPDILISDIGMPGMDGYELMRQVRTFTPEQGGKILAIALTAYARDIDQQQALAAGFQKYISKPVALEKLIQMIVSLINA
jgi:CheY-like chemotaxis protein